MQSWYVAPDWRRRIPANGWPSRSEEVASGDGDMNGAGEL